MSTLGPRQVAWVESSPSRVLMTGTGPLPVYQHEVVVVIVARTVDEARRLLSGDTAEPVK